MSKITINAQLPEPIKEQSTSFSFNYGKATITLDKNGSYQLLVNGSNYSAYEGSAKRDPEYKIKMLEISQKMYNEYINETLIHTKMNKKMAKVHLKVYYEKKLGNLTPEHYQRRPFSISQPTKEEVVNDLKNEAYHKFYSLFSNNKRKKETFINGKLKDIFNQRLDYWNITKSFFEDIETAIEYKKNEVYIAEYNQKKERLETFINGQEKAVEEGMKTLANDISIPFQLDVDYTYSAKNKLFTANLEIPKGLNIPLMKASILSTGKISIKSKTLKENLQNESDCILGVIYYFSSLVFNITPNIETARIALWDSNRSSGFCWVELNREKFSQTDINTLEPIISIYDYPHVLKLKTDRNVNEIVRIEYNEFIQRITQTI
ncbi:hypothetical protein [Bacteroides faecium]|uniref:Uncharacterized protein n=1 Tax=Bacteroides faecium TaxID=2715212 RepID=A0A6H0KUH1_9BACE|nr:hypothetical protein [Bacteroides faecium]QIU97124.1 hypothetical protein BacF7301_24545 [Bacteroides faecium]